MGKAQHQGLVPRTMLSREVGSPFLRINLPKTRRYIPPLLPPAVESATTQRRLKLLPSMGSPPSSNLLLHEATTRECETIAHDWDHSSRFTGGDRSSRLIREVIISVKLIPTIFLPPLFCPHDYTCV